jgi:5-methyltetrahydrofolate--homocysteine methyltransferase
VAAADDSKEEETMPARSAGNAEGSHPFVVIGENVHTTRVVRRPGPLVRPDDDGRESIEFTDEAGETRLLPIPPEELRTQDYQEGRVKHVRSAVRVALSGGPDGPVGLAYLHAVALRQVAAGAQYLDVNVDEYSHRLHEQIEVMTWLVGELAPIAGVPLSIDSSNLDIIRAGLQACGGEGDPPMLNSASLERAEALELAAAIGGAVIVTSAGATGMPSDSEQRVANGSEMIERALARGIPMERIYVDPLVFPISVDGAFGEHCLAAIRELRLRFGPELHITGGMSNVSFGIPQRRLINDVFLVMAVEAGADSGIIDPIANDVGAALARDRSTRPFQLALDVLTGADRNCRAYMKAFRAGELEEVAAT